MTDDDLAEAAIVERLVGELAGKQERMELLVLPGTVFELTALLQLACRHPLVSAAQRATAARWQLGVREYFADCPTVLEVLRRGEDPEEDVAR